MQPIRFKNETKTTNQLLVRKTQMANKQNKEILQLTAIIYCEFRSFLHRKFKYTTIKQHKEFFNDDNGKVGTKSSIKHRRNANKNHHLKRQPTGKTTRRGKFYIHPPYFRHLNEYNCSNTQSNYSLCLNLLASAFILYKSQFFRRFFAVKFYINTFAQH